MTELVWDGLPAGTIWAPGARWNYLIACDGKQAVLTRWEPWGDHYQTATQAALYAIRIGGVAAMEVRFATLKVMAQQYEYGISLIGQHAWRHDHSGAGTGSGGTT